MRACLAEELCASWIGGRLLSDDSWPLSPARADDGDLMAELTGMTSKDLL